MTLRNGNHRLFLFSYFGGKSKIVSLYPPPVGNMVIEPFAGAANYSCGYYRKQVILYEINPVIFGVLDFLIRSTPEEILRLPLLEPGQSVRDLKVHQEAKNYIGMMVNQGVESPRFMMSKWALERKKQAGVWTRTGRFRAARTVRRIKHWKVFNRPCWDAFREYGRNPDVTWFIDPPYQGKPGSRYPNGSSNIDFARLGKFVRSLRGAAIVCEGPEATWLPFKQLVQYRGSTQSKKYWEMVYLSGFPEEQKLMP